ncbi:MAG TPA: serine/threonine-protein kinase [Blastocatellia bacterium]|jgi:serine/threonine-protein kinase
MIGSVVANYKIIDKIGEGGMGAVFRGVDTMLEREVAIKMLRPELSRQPNIVERFRTEAVTLAKLNHPNIATLYNFLRQGDDFFMVMEYVRGETLDSVIRRLGAIGCERAVQLFCLALEGIDHAHKLGIVHRDIKPANIMLTNSGSIKVMDFGIARVLGSSRMTKTGHLIGTVEYMSPEQVRGEETDARSDIYSLGILLYEMLTGRVPFSSTSEYELMRSQIETAPPPPTSFAPNIPLPIEQAIMRALAKKAQARYQTAGEFRSVLLRSIGSLTMPLDEAAGVYAVPATRLGESAMNAPPSGEMIKETRLPAPAELSSMAQAGEVKETRLAHGSGDAAAYQQASSQGFATQPHAAKAPGSLLNKLNWKHYAGAAAALAALIIFPLVLLGGADKPSTPNPANPRAPATVQPSTVQPGQAPAVPAAGAEQNLAPAPSQPGFQPPSASDLNRTESKPGGDSASGSAKSTRSRNTVGSSTGGGSTGGGSTGAGGTGGGSTGGGGTRAEHSAQSSAAPQEKSSAPSKATRAEASDDDDDKRKGKKDKLEKVAEAAGAVGGAAKKIGGFFKRKKND